MPYTSNMRRSNIIGEQKRPFAFSRGAGGENHNSRRVRIHLRQRIGFRGNTPLEILGFSDVLKADLLFYVFNVCVHFTIAQVGYIGVFYQFVDFFGREVKIHQNDNGAKFLNRKKSKHPVDGVCPANCHMT